MDTLGGKTLSGEGGEGGLGGRGKMMKMRWRGEERARVKGVHVCE